MMVTPCVNMIRVDSITVLLGGQPIFEDFSLDIARGEKVALFGASGSGKSTLLRTLIGMHLPLRGSISFGGMAFTQENLPGIRRQLFYLPQDIVPQGDETMLEYLKTPFNLGVNKKTPFPESQMVEQMGVLQLKSELLSHPLYALSGGERKRVGLLAGFLLNRSIVIADEPTAGVDSANRDVIGELLFGKSDTTMLAVTHDETLLSMAGRSVEMPASRLKPAAGGVDGRP